MFLFFILSLFTLPAHAQPEVGDFAEYEVSSSMNNGILRRWVSRTEIIALDQATKKFKIKTTNTETGKQPVTEEKEIDLQQLVDRENDIKTGVQRCVQNGGRFVVVAVPAGRFRSCLQPLRSPETNTTVWLMDAPALAIVREEMFLRANKSRYTIRALKRFKKF